MIFPSSSSYPLCLPLTDSSWYGITSNGPRVLIFNQQGRSEAVDFLEPIYEAAKRPSRPAFDHVIFCTNVTYAETGYKRDFVNNQFDAKEIRDMVVQRRFAEKWSSLDTLADVRCVPTIEEAINTARELGKDSVAKREDAGDSLPVDAFVTGSLHLVGGALGIVEKADAL